MCWHFYTYMYCMCLYVVGAQVYADTCVYVSIGVELDIKCLARLRSIFEITLVLILSVLVLPKCIPVHHMHAMPSEDRGKRWIPWD